MTPPPSNEGIQHVPVSIRVKLAHAAVAHIFREANIPVIHFKGYTSNEEVYIEGRESSDADVLIHPRDQRRAISTLTSHGWDTVTSFRNGSIFRHAASLWHSHLGYIDLHRSFPGFTIADQDLFNELWESRTVQVIANKHCLVPSLQYQRLLVVAHAARDSVRGTRDVDYLRSTVPENEWDELRELAVHLGAQTPWEVATGEPVNAPPAEVQLWKALQRGADRHDLLTTRLASAPSLRKKVGILAGSAVINKAHLQMSLGRQPRIRDFGTEYWTRARTVFEHFDPR